MKFIDEYRDPDGARAYSRAIHELVTRPWTLMEVCGSQTHAIVRFGVDQLLPDDVTLIHGPGCPVCVTPVELIDRAIAIALRPDVTFCSYGDMLRVPGTERDLLSVKAQGADVRMVYSPMDAVTLAAENPDREVVFFAIGFETTAPANALAIHRAHQQELTNFSVLVAHVCVPPAMEAILQSSTNRVQGFLAAGHVCTVMGTEEYEPIAMRYHVPIVVTGFEPLDLLQGIYHCLKQLEEGRAEVEIPYARSVRAEGNRPAQDLIRQVFWIRPRKWRGIGDIPQSGLALRPPYDALDAEVRFDLSDVRSEESPECVAGQVLQGVKRPPECSAFGTRCTPEKPLGAPMVSSEGACAAYYRFRRHETEAAAMER